MDKEELINDKIKILKDFCILSKGRSKSEPAVRNILKGCDTEYQMENKLHDLLCGNETLQAFITRNVGAQNAQI